MRLARLVPCVLLLTGTASLSAQIPTRRPAQATGQSAVRLLVGNPHSFNAADSAPSVAIGDGARTRMEKVVGSQFRTLTRNEMNEALLTYGYPKDAILAALPLRSLAQSLTARALVTSSMTRDAGGRYTITSRMAGLNDDAGNVVVMTQAAGQSLADLGGKVADGFQPAVKSWDDAKACVDQSKNAPEKAVQSAKKAIAVLPDHGLANLCLAQLALGRGKKADSAEAVGYLKTAVKGDPLSLNAWTLLAAGYEVGGDTTATVDALLKMLSIAPTNQPLRDLVFKKLLAYGRVEAAERVADEGLQLDPSNVELLDLRANARIFRENYSGALDDLEQIIALDSTRADTTFYVKYLVTAGVKPDTARLVQWSSRATQKFPDNLTLIKQAAGAFSQVGLPDSLLRVLGQLQPLDSAAAVGFALQEAKNQQDAKAYDKAGPFIDFAAAHGDAQSREGAAGLLLNGTLPYIQPPQNWDAAVDGLKRVVSLANPAGRYAPIANYFLGLALVNKMIVADKQAETEKSCDIAKQVDAMSGEADTALGLAQPYIDGPGASQKAIYDQLKGYLPTLRPRTASMIRVYCK